MSNSSNFKELSLPLPANEQALCDCKAENALEHLGCALFLPV